MTISFTSVRLGAPLGPVRTCGEKGGLVKLSWRLRLRRGDRMGFSRAKWENLYGRKTEARLRTHNAYHLVQHLDFGLPVIDGGDVMGNMSFRLTALETSWPMFERQETMMEWKFGRSGI